MIAIIDYEMGNLRSVGNALDRLGAEWRLTADPAEIRSASKVILPVSATMPRQWRDCVSAVCVKSSAICAARCSASVWACR